MDKNEAVSRAIAHQNWPEAETILRELTANPHCHASYFYNLAKVLEMRGKLDECGVWLLRAVQTDADYLHAWFELGRWQLAKDNLQQAYLAFGEVCKRSSTDDDAWRNFARLALRLGQWDVAADAWSRFDDDEAIQAHYRIGVERGEDMRKILNDMLKVQHARPATLQIMTRTAKGSIPFQID